MSENPKSTEELLSEISQKLDKIIGVLVIQNIEDVDEKIYALKKLGFNTIDIGLLVSKTGRIRDSSGWKRK